MCPVSDLQLAEDVRDVVTISIGTEDEASSNLSIAVTLSDEVEDFALALGQFGECLRRRNGPGSGKEIDQAGGDGRAEDGLTSTNGADGLEYIGLLRVFEHVASRARPHSREHRG